MNEDSGTLETPRRSEVVGDVSDLQAYVSSHHLLFHPFPKMLMLLPNSR